MGITINRPPRDGPKWHSSVSPDLHSIELLQKGDAKPPAEPLELHWPNNRTLVRYFSVSLAGKPDILRRVS